MAAVKKAAKLATDNKGSAEHLTKRRCEHCGELIPAKLVSVVKRTSAINDSRKSQTRMIYFIKGHESL